MQRFHHLATALMLTLIALALGASGAEACSCTVGARIPCSFGQDTVAFVGTVVDVVESGEGFDGVRRITFEVTEGLAGVRAGTRIDAYSDLSSCGVRLDPGESYLVTDQLGSNGRIMLSVCGSYTLEASTAASELAILRGLRHGSPGGAIYGVVSEIREPRPHNRPTDKELYPDLPGVRVTLSGAGTFRETLTDAEGRYRFEGLAPGEYRVAARVSSPLVLLPHSRSFHTRYDNPDRVVIDSCPAHVSFVATQWAAMTDRLAPAATVRGCGGTPPRSTASATAASLTFDNGTGDTVNVYWMDFNGQRQHYATLPPGAALTQQTYLTHPWLVTNETGQCLEVFEPQGAHAVAYVAPH